MVFSVEFQIENNGKKDSDLSNTTKMQWRAHAILLLEKSSL